jgi:branched-chain amino acid transport system substrate-binding protein
MKKLVTSTILGAGLLGLSLSAASAQEPLKIGLVSVLSGPQAALGQQVRDGFQLAIKDLGGKIAGRPVEVVVIDDELKPDVAVSKVRGLLEKDKVDFVVVIPVVGCFGLQLLAGPNNVSKVFGVE